MIIEQRTSSSGVLIGLRLAILEISRPLVALYVNWEPAFYLDTEEARQAYLEEVLSDSNGAPTEVLRALGVVARAKGLPKIAEEIGISKQGLYKSLGETGNPTWETVCKVADALGLRLTFVPRSVGE